MPGVTTTGRELDELVAVRVFGWRRYRFVNCQRADENRYWLDDPAERKGSQGFGIGEGIGKEEPYSDALKYVPAYSSDIAAAWLVVERLAADCWSMSLEWKGRGRGYEHTAEVLFQRWVGSDFDNAHAVDDSAPLAICRAALAALAAEADQIAPSPPAAPDLFAE